MFFFDPFDACAKLFRDEADRRVGAVILNECGRIEFESLAVYIGNVRTDVDKDCNIFVRFGVLALDGDELLLLIPRNVGTEVFRNESCRKHGAVVHDLRSNIVCFDLSEDKCFFFTDGKDDLIFGVILFRFRPSGIQR